MEQSTTRETRMNADQLPPRRLTYEEARAEQRLHASKMTIPERLAAMTALNERMRSMRGIKADEDETYWNPRWVSRGKR
jgi:hypothetical protein